MFKILSSPRHGGPTPANEPFSGDIARPVPPARSRRYRCSRCRLSCDRPPRCFPFFFLAGCSTAGASSPPPSPSASSSPPLLRWKFLLLMPRAATGWFCKKERCRPFCCSPVFDKQKRLFCATPVAEFFCQQIFQLTRCTGRWKVDCRLLGRSGSGRAGCGRAGIRAHGHVPCGVA